MISLSNITLPSNRKFGFFFSTIILVASAYFFMTEEAKASYLLGILGLIFIVISLFKPDILLPLNKLWIRFGLLLGVIISPIVLGFIFFGIFTPISILTRLLGRDELQLRLNNKDSHWIFRDTNNIQTNNFKNQF